MGVGRSQKFENAGSHPLGWAWLTPRNAPSAKFGDRARSNDVRREIRRKNVPFVLEFFVLRIPVAYIGPKSRTERPRKTKIGTEVAHVTHDSDTTFKVKRSKVKVASVFRLTRECVSVLIDSVLFLSELTGQWEYMDCTVHGLTPATCLLLCSGLQVVSHSCL